MVYSGHLGMDDLGYPHFRKPFCGLYDVLIVNHSWDAHLGDSSLHISAGTMGSLLLSAFSTTLLGDEPGSLGAKTSIRLEAKSDLWPFFLQDPCLRRFLGLPMKNCSLYLFITAYALGLICVRHC